MIGGINFFCYNTLDIVPLGTSISYEYQITGSSTWIPFNSNTVVCLNLDAPSIEIRATLYSNFNTLTPSLLLKGASITMYNSLNTSTVISKQVEYPEPYKKITIIIDYIKPSNTNINVYYSPNDGYSYQGVEWKPLNILPNSTIILDPALQIYRSTYYLEEASYTYINLDQRVKFRYKLDITPTLTGISPLIKNIQTYVE
jgi:glycyl-tRNA synthetase (class II)